MRVYVRTDPAHIRTVLAYDRQHGPVAAMREFGASCQALYLWRAKAAELGDWPNDRDVADWHAKNAAQARIRSARERSRRRRWKEGHALTVDPTGTMRRVRALYALGWTWDALAAESGVNRRQLQRWATGEHCSTRGVNIDSARMVAALYDRLSGTRPEGWTADRARRFAERYGWFTPDRWYDIDDPDETPDPGWAERTVKGRTRDEVLEEFDWLTSQGDSPEIAAERLGVRLDTVKTYRLRTMQEAC